MRRIAAAGALAAGLFALAAGAADPPPVDHFFRGSRFGSLTISPDGRSLAALAPVNGRQNVVIMDVKTKVPRAITNETARDIVYVQWISNKRLVLRTGSLDTQDADYRGGGLFAIDADGTQPRLLSESADERSTSGWQLAASRYYLVRTLPGDTDDVIAQEFRYADRRARAGNLVRLNTRTARATVISLGKPDSGEGESWIVDGKGVARVQVVRDVGRVRIHYRASADAPWVKLDDLASTEAGWRPLAIMEDDKTLVVADQRTRDKAALVRYDPATRTFGEVLAEHPQVNLSSVSLDYDGKPVGLRFEADRGGAAWFDEELARVQKGVDVAMPNTVNRIYWSRDRSVFLVDSSSDRSPGSLYVLDRTAGKMEWLFDRRPWIKPDEMAAMRPVRYAARDGLEIPAYLTLPKGGDKNLPMVVVVHGGPWVGGNTWHYDPEAQFLASRGYAVLQPNFRGTTRYGWKHFASSFGQWGRAMQDDITDGVKWAVEQGIADPKRVCIYGGSYGGYATMMGLAKDPDLYRCGINYVGVTDLPLLMTATWSDNAYSESVQYTYREMIGDVDRDAERLKATSPVELAARIKGAGVACLRRGRLPRADRARHAHALGPRERGCEARLAGRERRGPRLPRHRQPPRLLRGDGEIPGGEPQALGSLRFALTSVAAAISAPPIQSWVRGTSPASRLAAMAANTSSKSRITMARLAAMRDRPYCSARLITSSARAMQPMSGALSSASAKARGAATALHGSARVPRSPRPPRSRSTSPRRSSCRACAPARCQARTGIRRPARATRGASTAKGIPAPGATASSSRPRTREPSPSGPGGRGARAARCARSAPSTGARGRRAAARAPPRPRAPRARRPGCSSRSRAPSGSRAAARAQGSWRAAGTRRHRPPARGRR
jgi:dipeptidyl aminopeptidase/acylaminoacyl peptidase